MTKVGIGFDSHRFTGDRALLLGGIRIEGSPGLAGHSDADVVLHAITDAILGALAAGDIGEHFPDDAPQHEGADSSQFLRHACNLCREARCHVGNCDVVILAEFPRLGPYKQAIRERIADLLDVPASAVSIKAKSGEGMGFVGKGEGIAVLATVLLEASPPTQQAR